MKKTYVKPSTLAKEVELEQLIADSTKFTTQKGTEGDEADVKEENIWGAW